MTDSELIEIDWPEPCPECNSMEKWWSGTGVEHCMKCNPPERAMRWWSRADRNREAAKKPAEDEWGFT